jgi:hypothetical protein
MQWERHAIALAFVLLLGLVLYGGWRLRRLGVAFVFAAGVIAAAWALTEAAIRTDYRDADGYGDCWPHCTALQNGVGTMNALAPVASFGLIVATAALIALLNRGKGTQSRAGTS